MKFHPSDSIYYPTLPTTAYSIFFVFQPVWRLVNLVSPKFRYYPSIALRRIFAADTMKANNWLLYFWFIVIVDRYVIDRSGPSGYTIV